MWQRIYQGVTHYLIYDLIIYHLPFVPSPTGEG